MKYNVTHADGTSLVFDDTIVDNKSTSLTFVSQDSANYGYFFWGNLVHLLENFSSPYSPDNKIVGQLWFNNKAKDLQLYDGSKWVSVAAQVEDMSGYAEHQDSEIIGDLVLPDAPLSTDPTVAVTRGYIESNFKYKFMSESAADIQYVQYENKYTICHNVISPTNVEQRIFGVNLPFTMADDNYSISLTFNSVDSTSHGDVYAFTSNKTRTGFTISTTAEFATIAWVVMGFTV